MRVKKENNNWCVYLLMCSDHTFYCGITNNLENRISAHNKGKGAKYTRGRLPVMLINSKGDLTKSEALKLEKKIKSTKRNKKIELISELQS